MAIERANSAKEHLTRLTPYLETPVRLLGQASDVDIIQAALADAGRPLDEAQKLSFRSSWQEQIRDASLSKGRRARAEKTLIEQYLSQTEPSLGGADEPFREIKAALTAKRRSERTINGEATKASRRLESVSTNEHNLGETAFIATHLENEAVLLEPTVTLEETKSQFEAALLDNHQEPKGRFGILDRLKHRLSMKTASGRNLVSTFVAVGVAVAFGVVANITPLDHQTSSVAEKSPTPIVASVYRTSDIPTLAEMRSLVSVPTMREPISFDTSVVEAATIDESTVEPEPEQPAPLVEVTPEAAPRMTKWGPMIMGDSYVVTRGDSLYTIAGRYFGDPTLYMLLAELNGNNNPSLIHEGDQIHFISKSFRTNTTS